MHRMRDLDLAEKGGVGDRDEAVDYIVADAG